VERSACRAPCAARLFPLPASFLSHVREGDKLNTGYRSDEATISARLGHGRTAIEFLDRHLAEHDFLVGELSIADISNFAYTHVAGDAGLTLSDYPAVLAWLARIGSLPHFVDDLIPYPENARRGNSRSIYD
jgi:glutathione S-transferase